FAWGIGGGGKSAPKTVLRGGFGLFYDRFSNSYVLNADRLNGRTQHQYAVSTQCSTPPCPAIDFFPNVPAAGQLPAQTTSPTYQIAPDLHASYIMQTAFTVERQVTKAANVAVTYLNSRGVHQFLSIDTNAPTPGTPNSTGPRPNPNAGDIYQYSSDGVFQQNQMIANFNIRAGTKLSLFGYYSLNYANSDASGAGNFPSNQYDLKVDYGRASFAIRDRVFAGGTIGIPRGFRLSPFMVFNSGSPYNVSVGQDLAGDLQFNVRPAFASNPPGTCPSPTLKCFYTFSNTPGQSYSQIPINYLTGPSQLTLNLRLAKTFGFGPETGRNSGSQEGGGASGGHSAAAHAGSGGGGSLVHGPSGGFGSLGPATTRRYSLTFSINARNVLNKVNAAPPVGVLSAPDFGHSIALAGGAFSSAAANRKVELQAMFSF
ncbi:MAG: carboxypeptidase regulatory-like domain-containing protein, partial [Terriglobales bacterium]